MENLEKKIEEWENYKKQLINKIANTSDEQKRIFLKKRLTVVEMILERLRDIQWRECDVDNNNKEGQENNI